LRTLDCVAEGPAPPARITRLAGYRPDAPVGSVQWPSSRPPVATVGKVEK